MVGRKKDVFASADGDFWRLLLPGEYKVKVSADGFKTMTKRVKVSKGPATLPINFVLKKGKNPSEQQDDSSEGSKSKDKESDDGSFEVSPEDAQQLMAGGGMGMPGMMAGGMGGSMGGQGMMMGAGQQGGMGMTGNNMGGMGGQGMMMGGQQGGMGMMGGGGMGGGMGMMGGGMQGGGMMMNDAQMGGMPNEITMGMHGRPAPSHEKSTNLHKALGRLEENAGLSDSSDSLSLGGPLLDSDLDREAMMSPYESNSKDTNEAAVGITTDQDTATDSQAFTNV